MMDFVLNMMNCSFKDDEFVLNSMDCALIPQSPGEYGWGGEEIMTSYFAELFFFIEECWMHNKHAGGAFSTMFYVDPKVLFVLHMMDFCVENDEFCSENDELCIKQCWKNGGCRSKGGYRDGFYDTEPRWDQTIAIFRNCIHSQPFSFTFRLLFDRVPTVSRPFPTVSRPFPTVVRPFPTVCLTIFDRCSTISDCLFDRFRPFFDHFQSICDRLPTESSCFGGRRSFVPGQAHEKEPARSDSSGLEIDFLLMNWWFDVALRWWILYYKWVLYYKWWIYMDFRIRIHHDLNVMNSAYKWWITVFAVLYGASGDYLRSTGRG